MHAGDNEKHIDRCYQLAISAGKKGFDTFGALVVRDGAVLEEAENTAGYEHGIFGHAEYNVVQKCAARYSDAIMRDAVLYTSCAPCVRCIMAIASLGIRKIVYGVSYEAFGLLLPFETEVIDCQSLLNKMGVEMEMEGPVLEDRGMHAFEYWGGNYRPLDELIKENGDMRRGNA